MKRCFHWGPHGSLKYDRKYIQIMVANLFKRATKRYFDETCWNMFPIGVFALLLVWNSNWPPNKDKSCIVCIHVEIIWKMHLILNQTTFTDNNFTKLCIKSSNGFQCSWPLLELNTPSQIFYTSILKWQ
jgi:hypothetical protein